MDWGSFVGGGITATSVIIVLSSWLGKVWANRILEQDKAKYKIQVDSLLQDLRTKESKELFVHRIQFEQEFEVYKDLWGGILTLGRAGKHFRTLAVGQIKPADEGLGDFHDAYTALNELVYGNRPFYAPSIFDLCKMLLDAAADIDRSIQRQALLLRKNSDSERIHQKLTELEDKIEEDLDKINEVIGDLCDAIRFRIWSTDKTGWDRTGDRETQKQS